MKKLDLDPATMVENLNKPLFEVGLSTAGKGWVNEAVFLLQQFSRRRAAWEDLPSLSGLESGRGNCLSGEDLATRLDKWLGSLRP
jgi:hypothetical protein